MLNGKRSQAALEFLMTYGWAILVVLIVISALAYFGVLNPQRMLPSRCTMPTGFSCQDYVARQVGTVTTINLNIVNGMGSPITVGNLTLLPQGNNPVCGTWSGDLNNGQSTLVTFNCTGATALAGGDQKYRWDIVMEYRNADSSPLFNRTIKGELLTTLES